MVIHVLLVCSAIITPFTLQKMNATTAQIHGLMAFLQLNKRDFELKVQRPATEAPAKATEAPAKR